MCEVDCNIDIVPTGREIGNCNKFGLEEKTRNSDGVNVHKIME